MKKATLFLTLAIAGCTAQPAFAQEFTSTIISSECQVVATSGSTSGALIGGAAGAVAGNIIGEALFGRSGRSLGTLLGGAGGAVAGEQLAASRTYSCLLVVKDPSGQHVYVESVGVLRNPGQQVRVYPSNSGTYIVR